MTSRKTITAVIACYNAEAFIAEAVQSVLDQTRQPCEVFVVDDASTDGTCDVVESFGKTIRVIRNQVNRGPGPCRNDAVVQSSGDYIAFLDADNIWKRGHLETVAALLDAHDEVGLAFSRREDFGMQSGVWPKATPPCEGHPCDISAHLFRNNCIELSTMVIPRKAFDSVEGFISLDERHRGRRILADDYFLSMRLALRYPLVSSAKATVRYRTYPEQCSANIGPATVQGYKYKRMAVTDVCSERRTLLMKKALLSWEEHLEWMWVRRDMASLRAMVWYGIRHPELVPSTSHYLHKCLLPLGRRDS